MKEDKKVLKEQKRADKLAKKAEKKKRSEEQGKKSFSEKLSLFLRKKCLNNGIETALIICILIGSFIALNLYVDSLDIKDIDVTENKIYTLSDTSKQAIQGIDEDVKIYLFGYTEDSTLTNLVKQYIDVNNHISYEILTQESNPAKYKEFDLQDGYNIVILETSEGNKIIDASSEFNSYDYTTGQEVDRTEQSLTNSILGITSSEKPKVYFLTGHNEYKISEMSTIKTYLGNESYTTDTLNLVSAGTIPEDCNLLAILNPSNDFTENETQAIKDYINKGGNILLTSDINEKSISENPNLQSILDLYGATVQNNGYIMESDSKKIASNYPNIIMPEVSSSSSITSEIYTDGYLLMPYSGRVTFKSDEELEKLNVTKENLINSSSSSLFITDLSTSVSQAAKNAEQGENVISAVATKTVKEAEGENEAVKSKLLVIANTVFASDYTVDGVSTTYPISYIGNNKDFMLNSISDLTKKEDKIKIRKDMSTSTYAPSQQQNIIVLSIVYAVPVLIILIGIFIGMYRKRKR